MRFHRRAVNVLCAVAAILALASCTVSATTHSLDVSAQPAATSPPAPPPPGGGYRWTEATRGKLDEAVPRPRLPTLAARGGPTASTASGRPTPTSRPSR